MKLKNFLILLGWLLSVAANAYLPVRIYSSDSLYKAEEKVEGAMLFMKKALKDSCGIDLDYQIQTIRETKDLGSAFNSTSYSKPYKTKYGKEDFIYFQKDFYRYLSKNSLLKKNHGINFHFVKDVSGHCGFAFPDIQLEKIKSGKIFQAMRNSILISKTAIDCGNRSRLLSHEMAHLMIQDNPAHMCDGVKCPESNILSVFREKPVPPPFFGNGMGMNNGFGMHPPHQAPEKIPSIGKKFNSQQCQAVEKFISQFI